MKLTEAINKLKSGIEEGDEELIEEGFYLLTGEKVVFPDEDPTMFSGGEYPHRITPPKPVTVTDQKAYGTPPSQEDFTMSKARENPQPRQFVNKFNPEAIKPDKEPGEDLLNDNVVPVPRTRGEFKMATVVCQDCSKTIEVNPQFKKEPYTCDLIRLGQSCPNA
jgi:hypothetical protein